MRLNNSWSTSMKFTKLLFVPASLLTLSMIEIPGKEIDVAVSTDDIYGPFTANENAYFRFSSNIDSRTIHGTLKGYKNGNYVFNRTIDIINGTSGDINVNTYNRLTTSGIRLDLSLTDGEDFRLAISHTIYPPLETSLVANRQTISYGGSIYGLIKNQLISEETYSFEDTNEYYSLSTGNRLDISEVCFEYSPFNKYSFTNAYLEINDNKNIYPNITKVNKTKVRFPLRLTNNSEAIQFEFIPCLYVNNSTLDMSEIKRSGYEPADSVYLPLGKEALLEDEESQIVIEGSGFNRNKITIPLSFYKSERLFGSCDDSDYCIHGGIKE